MIAFVWSIKEFSKEGLSELTPWIVIVVGFVMLVIFVRRNLSSAEPMLDVRLFKSRSFSAGTIAAFMTMFAMAAVLLLVAQWLQVVEGLSPFKAGFYQLPMAVGAMIFAPLAPGLATRLGARVVLPIGIAGELAQVANESVVGAVEVAKIMSLPQLATEAIAAFNDSFITAALIGGIIMMVVAVIIFFLIPKSLDITKQENH